MDQYPAGEIGIGLILLEYSHRQSLAPNSI